MTIRIVLTLALFALGFSGSVFASMNPDVRFTLTTAAQVNGVSLPAGDYLVRQLDMVSDSPVFLVYSANGKEHKATVAMRSELTDPNGPAELTFERANGSLELSAIRAQGH